MIKPITIIKAWINVFKGITTAKHKERYNVCKYCPSAEYKPYLDFINDELVDVKGMICNECKYCPSAEYKPYLDFINDELVDVKGMICNECKCPLVAKIRSNDKCPLNKW